MSRGKVTKEVGEKVRWLVGDDIFHRYSTKNILRLLVFLEYKLKNDGNMSNTNAEEREILKDLVECKFLATDDRGMYLLADMDFYFKLNIILYDTYVRKVEGL